MWTSYGIFRAIQEFVEGYDFLTLQFANKFCYDIAVSRAQLLVADKSFYFPNNDQKCFPRDYREFWMTLDLGTTLAQAAVADADKFEHINYKIILNEVGKPKTPNVSCISKRGGY